MVIPFNSRAEIIAHEIGHFIDDMLNKDPNEYASYILLDAYKYDVKYVENVFKEEFGYFSRRSYKTLCLQDLLFILTRGEYKTNYARNMNELKDIRKIKSEIFANLFSIRLLGDKKQNDFIKKNFPELWKGFDEIIKEYDKCGI